MSNFIVFFINYLKPAYASPVFRILSAQTAVPASGTPPRGAMLELLPPMPAKKRSGASRNVYQKSPSLHQTDHFILRRKANASASAPNAAATAAGSGTTFSTSFPASPFQS